MQMMMKREPQDKMKMRRPRPRWSSHGFSSLRRRVDGFSLIEVVIVLSIVGILLSMGVASFSNWSTRERLSNSAGELAQILFVARVEAIRKSVNHIVFFGSDASGGDLVSENGGTPVAALLIEDTNGNGAPDVGEQRMVVPMATDTKIVWGRTHAPILVPTNGGSVAGDPFSGTSTEGSAQEQSSVANFRHPSQADTVQSWILFAPDGTPRALDASAGVVVADVGTGDGAIYLSDGERDQAVVMTALGAVRSYRWDTGDGSWK